MSEKEAPAPSRVAVRNDHVARVGPVPAGACAMVDAAEVKKAPWALKPITKDEFRAWQEKERRRAERLGRLIG